MGPPRFRCAYSPINFASCFCIENILFICLSLFCDLLTLSITVLQIQIRDLGPWIRCLFDPCFRDPVSGMGKNQDPDPG